MASWDEINLDKGMWTIPGDRMKAGREHRVALSGSADSLLTALPRMQNCDWVFPGMRLHPLSDMTLAAVLKRMACADVTVHLALMSRFCRCIRMA